MSFPEARLRTGLPAEEAKGMARETAHHPDWVLDLLRISGQPKGGTIPRKASWVLRHAALYDLGLGLCADTTLPVAMVHVGVQLLHASGMPLGEEVAEVWRERGAHAETAPLARFLAKQLNGIQKRQR
jgi:hypothetical protein